MPNSETHVGIYVVSCDKTSDAAQLHLSHRSAAAQWTCRASARDTEKWISYQLVKIGSIES